MTKTDDKKKQLASARKLVNDMSKNDVGTLAYVIIDSGISDYRSSCKSWYRQIVRTCPGYPSIYKLYGDRYENLYFNANRVEAGLLYHESRRFFKSGWFEDLALFVDLDVDGEVILETIRDEVFKEIV